MGDICVVSDDLGAVGKKNRVVKQWRIDGEWVDYVTWSPDGRLLACNLFRRTSTLGSSFLGTALVSFAPCVAGS